jgi:hypothetical protein
MIFLVAMTRAQYLLQRESTAQVFRRKAIAPGVLLLFSFIVMTWIQRNKMQPSTWNELALYCLPLASFVFSLVWATVIGLHSDKLNTIRCSSCGKNNGNERARLWLIASGNCFYCHEKMFQEAPAAMNTAEDKPLISRAEYESKLKLTEAQLAKAALLVGAPLAILLVWWAFLSGYPANMDSEPVEPKVSAILMGALFITLGFMCYLESRIKKQSGARCTNCGAFPSPYYKKIVLATGGCVRCGHRMFGNQ